MKAEQFNKLNGALNINVPKKDRDMRAHFKNVIYIDPTRVVMVKTTDMTDPDGPARAYSGPEEVDTLSEQPLKWIKDNGHSTVIDRKLLIEVLQSMDSDHVAFVTGDETPVGIIGYNGHDIKVEAVIAPRIYDSFDENTEGYFYD
mgnify:CR=1 FL=1